MAAEPVKRARAESAVDRWGLPTSPWLAFAASVALGIGIVLRFLTVSDLWLDEALTVHISQVPWGDLEPALRRDGAPPLFYALLHLWMDVFGDSNAAARALPGVLSVLTLPLAWFAGRRVGGTRVAWITVMLLAASPYAIRYATETRMYALEILLVFAGYLALVRAIERPSWGRLGLLAVVTALLLYNQYWSPYLVAVVGLGLLVAAWRASGPQRRSVVCSLLAVGVGCLLFAPWLPTLLYQSAHTGTPWGETYFPTAGLGLTAIEFSGARWALGWALAGPLVILPFLGLMGRSIDGRHIELDLTTVPETRWIAGAAVATLMLGLTASWLTDNTYEGRYGAVVFPLFLLLVARGVATLGDPRVRIGLLAVLVVLGLATGYRHATEERTQADIAAALIRDGAESGDVVVYCPDQLGPGVSRLLGETDLEQVTFPRGDRPEFVDWVDYAMAYERTDVDAFADDVLDSAGDRTVWFVSATGYEHTDGPCGALDAALSAARPNAGRLHIENTDVFEHHSVTRFDP